MIYKSLIVSAVAFGIAFLVVPLGNPINAIDMLRLFISLVSSCCGLAASVAAGIMFVTKS